MMMEVLANMFFVSVGPTDQTSRDHGTSAGNRFPVTDHLSDDDEP